MLIEMLIYLLKYKQASVKAKNLGIPFGYWMVYTHCFVELSVESLMNVKRKIGKWLGLWLCVFISYFSFRLQFRSYEIVSFFRVCKRSRMSFGCIWIHAYMYIIHSFHFKDLQMQCKYADCIHAKEPHTCTIID